MWGNIGRANVTNIGGRVMDTASLTNLVEYTYDELEELNLKARSLTDPKKAEEQHIKFIKNEKRIKTVTACFTDLEGRLHTLDYNKDFMLSSLDNLTFDGSSIRGFSAQNDSDLRFFVDWTSLTFLPVDVFGAGKVLVFGNVFTRDLQPYESDFRVRLQRYNEDILKRSGLVANMATELEGYLVSGVGAEQRYSADKGFAFESGGGYFHALPLDNVSRFIDKATQVQVAMGFRNEKQHPEVGPSQFEIDYSYTDVLRACDQVQLYKLVCRQIGMNMGMTVTFLPKPITGINGNGMHTNFSLSKNDINVFFDNNGQDRLSKVGWDFTNKLLQRAEEFCLIINSSVNAYRRLDPHFEAPNEIKVSANDRGSLIRLPFGNEKTTRIEIRAVSPDTNPYLALYTIIRIGLEDVLRHPSASTVKAKFLPDTIEKAIKAFKKSEFIEEILGKSNRDKFVELKEIVAKRIPKNQDVNSIDASEILLHHEVTNQYLWNRLH
jgi:glutamine synthetase